MLKRYDYTLNPDLSITFAAVNKYFEDEINEIEKSYPQQYKDIYSSEIDEIQEDKKESGR
jgi:hypothetical protein